MSIRIQISHSLLSLPPIPLLYHSHLSFEPECESESESETRIATAVSTLVHHRSKTRWARLRSLFPVGLTPPESASILLRIRNHPRLALRYFQWAHPNHDLRSHSAIIHILARHRLKSLSLSLIRSAIVHQPESESESEISLFRSLSETYRLYDSAPFVFDLLIQAYLQSKKLDLAARITRILRSNKIQPLTSTCNSLIRSVSRRNGSDAGLSLYTELFDGVRVLPNVSTFNSLLLAFYREGRLEMAGEMRKEMERVNCKPNVFTYSILMAGLCDEGLVDEAIKIWREMEGNGVKPDVMAFNTLIKGYCEVEELEKAEELFREMGLSGIEPTGPTFECLVSGYCRVGEVDSALVLWRDAKRRGFGLEIGAVDEVVEGLCEKGRVSEGLEVLREEMKREGFGPSRRSYEALIRGFCRGGEMEVAGRIQAEMAGRGFEAGVEVYGEFVEGYRRLGDGEMAARLEKEMDDMGFGGDCNADT